MQFDYQIDYRFPSLEKVQNGYFFVPKNLKLIRIIHDGSNTSYNERNQFRNDISDIPCEGYVTNVWKSIEAVGTWVTQQGFTGVKSISCFFVGQNVPHHEKDYKPFN